MTKQDNNSVHSSQTKLEKWDKRFLRLAKEVSTWSKDPSTKVGAVIVRPDNSVCSVGFNGFARGVIDKPERYADRDTKVKLVIHAEVNAKNFAREPLDGYTLYTYPFPPCSKCTGELINSGIKRFVSIIPDEHYNRWKEDWDLMHLQCNEALVFVQLYGMDGV